MVAIIGRGNVASHLFSALKDKTEVCLVNPHTFENYPQDPDIVLICVSDNAIEEVVNKLPISNSIVAHTAGSIPMDILKGKTSDYGVFYPLQTFSKDAILDYSEIPVFIEGSSPETVKKLKELASLFSKEIKEADSQTRKSLHLASVFACNFTNALAGIAEGLLKKSGIEFSVLFPLIKQTVNKLELMSPKEAQTGPAKRGDTKVMMSHMEMLSESPDLGEIYSLLSSLIARQSSESNKSQNL